MTAVLRGELGIEGDRTLLDRRNSSPAPREEIMSDDLVKILGNHVRRQRLGKASMTDPTGLFSFDNRFLSTWVTTVNGERLNPLSVDDLQYFETFLPRPGHGHGLRRLEALRVRRRAVGDGFHEELTILNHDEQAVDLTVRIDAASDFADLFEVKDALERRGAITRRSRGNASCSGTSANRSRG